jgi:hypothetical protein
LADSSRYSTRDDDTSAESRDETALGMPHWVKVAGIVAIVLALLIVVVILMMILGGGGQHNPLRHLQSGSYPSSFSVILAVVQPL